MKPVIELRAAIRRCWAVLLLVSAVMALATLNLHAAGSTANGTHSVPAVMTDCAAGENCYRLRRWPR